MASLSRLGDRKWRSSRSRRSTNHTFDDCRSEVMGSEWTMGSAPDSGGEMQQRVVLGRRGPGCILGDEIMRETNVVVTVIAIRCGPISAPSRNVIPLPWCL